MQNRIQRLLILGFFFSLVFSFGIQITPEVSAEDYALPYFVEIGL